MIQLLKTSLAKDILRFSTHGVQNKNSRHYAVNLHRDESYTRGSTLFASAFLASGHFLKYLLRTAVP